MVVFWELKRFRKRSALATHSEVIAALAAERVDWTKLTCAGTPQLPYEELKKLPNLYMASVEELRRIPDPEVRKIMLRVKREATAVMEKGMQSVEE